MEDCNATQARCQGRLATQVAENLTLELRVKSDERGRSYLLSPYSPKPRPRSPEGRRDGMLAAESIDDN